MVAAIYWFLIAVTLILAIVAVAVVLVVAYDFWKESDLKQDLDERRRNRRNE